MEASSPFWSFIWRRLSWLIRSKYSLCQIITLFSRQLQNLLYQLARSPAAAIYLCLPCACRGKGLRAQPAEHARAGRGAGSCPAAFSRARQVEGISGTLPRTGRPAGSLRGGTPPPERSFPRGRHTCTPDVAQEGEPAEPGVRTRRFGSGLGRGSAEENAEPEPRMWP